METKKKPFHETVAENLIRQLEQGTAPWQRPWEPGDPGSLVPFNPVTGKRYKGINALQLMAQERDDQRWMTYKQSVALGGQVRKGERGTGIQYWKFTDEFIKKDSQGKPVFNADQIEGLPPLQKKEQTWDAIERAEAILTASGVVIYHNAGGSAFYRPSSDSIHLPEKSQFLSADKFYATALHELGHATGHKTRLDRDLAHPFGSEGYAKEELRAEISSMLLGDALGIGHDPGQHAAYVGSWIKALQDDPLEIFRAAADAEKIQDYVLGLEHQQVQDQLVESVSKELNQESAMPNPSAVANPATLSAYQTELARLLKLSPLMPGDYVPSDADSHKSHVAVFAGDSPVILCGNSDDPASIKQAQALAASPFVREVFKALTPMGTISSGVVKGGDIQWQAIESAVLSKPLGRIEVDSDSGALVAVVLNDPTQALTTRLCVTTETARIFDPDTPELDNGKVLPALASIEDEEMALRAQASLSADKTYLDVPYCEKDEAKALGAKWDRGAQSWYVTADVELEPFDKWMQNKTATDRPLTARTLRNITLEAYKSIDLDENKAVSPGDLKAIQSIKADKLKLEARNKAVLTRYNRLLANRNTARHEARHYLAVPYSERKAAKAAGALWGKTAKSWYVGPEGNMDKLARWKPDNVAHQQGPAMQPEEEFSETLRSVGCVVNGNHPIMDGATHRITVDGDKAQEKSGFYVGHLDGLPAGYIKNNRTDIDMKWKSKGYTLNSEEKALLQAESAAKLHERELATQAKQKAVAMDIAALLRVSESAPADHPYLLSKQVRPGDLRIVPPASTVLPDGTSIIIGADWKESTALREAHPDKVVFTTGDLLVPAYDAECTLWSAQSIQASGRKIFAKDSVKQANFHVVGANGHGLDALKDVPAIVISEGYASADSLSNVLGFPTVSAFDSGNLEVVAKSLHEKFPDKPIVVAGDDDKHLESTQGVNPGRTKAISAAKSVGGKAIFPIFAPGEQSSDTKKFTDFNDLATKSVLGAGGVERQVVHIVNSLTLRNQAPTEKRNQQEAAVKLEPQTVKRKTVKL